MIFLKELYISGVKGGGRVAISNVKENKPTSHGQAQGISQSPSAPPPSSPSLCIPELRPLMGLSRTGHQGPKLLFKWKLCRGNPPGR